MESFPKNGMTYKQSVSKGVRFAKEGNSRLVESVTNQVRRHEGDKAASEFVKEVASKGRDQSRRKYF